MTAVLLIALFGMLLLGTPIYMALMLSSAAALEVGKTIDTIAVLQRMLAGIDKFSIMSVPFFMFCADLMSKGQIGKRLINVCKAFFGHLHGGLAIATTVACLIFGAVSGAGAAAVVAVGALVYTLMCEGLYDQKFSVGLILCTSTLAMLIPPSIAYILFSNITGDSVSVLFMSGMGSGIIFGLIIMVYSYIYAKRKNIPTLPKASKKERWDALKDSLLSLGLIVIILGGIYGGICTATEAAALGCIYAIILEVFVYKSMNLKDLYRVAISSGRSISMVMLLIAAGSILSWVMTVMQLPQMLVALFAGASKSMVLVAINIMFLIAGMFIDPNSAIIVLLPLAYPLAMSAGINSVHLATIIVINLAIGMLTPPFGMNLFVGASVFKKSYADVVPGVISFIIISVIVLILFTVIPGLSLYMPHLVYGR